MKRQFFILVAAFSLLISSMACGILDREVAIEDLGLTITNFNTAPEAASGVGVEIASIDISRVWAPTNLNSYRSEFEMEIWFEDATEDSSIRFTSSVMSTSNPTAQYILSSNESILFPEDMPKMETEMYVIEGVVYSKSSLIDQWTAFDGEIADIIGDLLLNPQDYVILPENAQRNTAPETVNGIPSWHYSFDETAFEDAPMKYDRVSTELWIAVEGGFIVKSESYAEGGDLSDDLDDNFFGGMLENSRVRSSYNRTDINGNIHITLPEEAASAEVSDLFGGLDFDSEWSREDVPFPDAAEIDYSFSDTIALLTPSSVQDVKDFMLPQMVAYGWSLEMEHINSDEYYLADYIKGDDFLSLSIDTDLFDETQTSIHVDVKKSVPWTREDVNFPPDALIEHSFEGEIYVLTYWVILDATDFMVSQLESHGWESDTILLNDASGYMGNFSKGIETLTLMIDPAFDEQGRIRIEIILE